MKVFNPNNNIDYLLQAKEEIAWFLSELKKNLKNYNENKELVIPGPYYSENPRFQIKQLLDSIDRRLAVADPRYSVAYIDKLYSVAAECIHIYSNLTHTPINVLKIDFTEYPFFKDGSGVPAKYIYFNEISFCIQFSIWYADQRQLVSKIHEIEPLDSETNMLEFCDEKLRILEILKPALIDVSSESSEVLASLLLRIKYPNFQVPKEEIVIPFSISQTQLCKLLMKIRHEFNFQRRHRKQIASLIASIPQGMNGTEVLYFNEKTIYKSI